MKHRIWLVIPLLSLLGVSACSGDTSSTSAPGPAVTAVPGVTASPVAIGLDGVEFVVHQAPG